MERLSYRVVSSATALVVRLEGLDTLYERTSTRQIADVASELYEQMDQAAHTQGVLVVDRRIDRFIFMDVSAKAPFTEDESGTCSERESLQKLLAIAVDLHRRFPATLALRSYTGLKLTMGVASGPAVLLGAEHRGGAPSALGVHGVAVDRACAMAELGAAGTVAVDDSTLWRWAAAARSLPPPSSAFACGGGGGLRRAALFDLSARVFWYRPPPPGPACAAQGGGAGAARLRRSSSFS